MSKDLSWPAVGFLARVKHSASIAIKTSGDLCVATRVSSAGL